MPPTDKDKRPPTSSEPARVAPAPVSSARLSTLNRLGALAATVAVIQTGCGAGGSTGGNSNAGPGPSAGVGPGPSASGEVGAVPSATASGEVGAVPSATASGEVGAVPSTTASAEPSSTPGDRPIAPPHGSGYAVVDPMPPPSRCMGVAGTITAKAVWKAKAGGGFVVELHLGKPSRGGASYVTTEEATSWSAKIVSKQITADKVLVTLEPSKQGSSVGVSLGMQCSSGQSHVTAQLDLTKPPAADQAVPVVLSDRY